MLQGRKLFMLETKSTVRFLLRKGKTASGLMRNTRHVQICSLLVFKKKKKKQA